MPTMPALLSPLRAKRLRRSLYNLQVSISCFVLTVLMLRNTIGAGKFGTPAQDFEELKHQLHQVALHRKHTRVLAEAIEDQKPARVISVSDASFLDGWRRLKSVENPPRTGADKVLIVTGSWPFFYCAHNSSQISAAADHLSQQFLRNKVDFSKSHGMEILYHTGHDMPDRLELLLRLMQDGSARNVEWLWWMDSDSLIIDPSFELPLDSYTGRNLVLLGKANSEVQESGSMRAASVETEGSFLIRNCEWSLELLQKSMQIRREEGSAAGGSGKGEMQAAWRSKGVVYYGDKVLSDDSYSLRIDRKWLERHESNPMGAWPAALVSFQRCGPTPCRIHDDDVDSCLWQMDTALRFTDPPPSGFLLRH